MTRTCDDCGAEMTLVGFDVSPRARAMWTVLDYECPKCHSRQVVHRAERLKVRMQLSRRNT